MRRDYELVQDPVPRAAEMKRKRSKPELRIIASPAYDLLLSLHVVFGSPLNDYEVDPLWREQARAACPPELATTLEFFFGDSEGQWCAASLCRLLWRAPNLASIPDVIAWLAQLPVEDVLPVIIGSDGLGDDWREVAQSLIRAQLAAKSTRKSDLATKIQSFARRFRNVERESIVRFLTQPEEERARLIAAIEQWYQRVFAAEEPRIRTALAREAARLERKRGEVSVEDLFTGVVRGIVYDIPAATERLVLAPSLMIMPTVFHFADDDTLTYCYPVKDAEQQGDDQQLEMVRLFDALADKTRLKILRLLTQRQMYLTELTEHLEPLTKATIRHHMVRLRAAKLVTVHISDHLTYYSLRRETLEEPTRMILRYLDMQPQASQ